MLAPREDAIYGIKVDREGNLYVSGPGSLWVISPEGKHPGMIIAPKHIHSFAWGNEDGKTPLSIHAERIVLPDAGQSMHGHCSANSDSY